MSPDYTLGAALLLGLLGAGHCIGMCGGISGALAFALGPRCSTPRKHLLLVLYSAGRVTSYAVMGALAGGAIGLAAPTGGTVRIVAGALLVLTGLAVAGWSGALGPIERIGSLAWQRIAPFAARLGAPDRPHIAIAAGAAWGWLPCGLVYSALAWSASSGSALRSAALMTAFGLGTMPAVLASGAFAGALRSLLQRRGLRLMAALCLCAFGIWTMAAAGGGGHGQHAHH